MYKNHGLAAYERERSNILAFLILALDKQERSAPRSDSLLPEKGLGMEIVFGPRFGLNVVEHRKPKLLARIQDPSSRPLKITFHHCCAGGHFKATSNIQTSPPLSNPFSWTGSIIN
jgi:hypothetical protein